MSNTNKSKDIEDKDSGTLPEAGGETAVIEAAVAVSVKERSGLLRALFFFLLPYMFNALITIGLISGYHYFIAPQIVAMDIKGFISQQRELYVLGKIDSDQFKKNVDRMEAMITGLRPNQVALMGDAVIRNVKVIDVFPEESKDRK